MHQATPDVASTITTKHLTGPSAFDALSADWDKLAQSSLLNTPFQTLAYQRTWWQHLGQGDLHTIAVYDAGALIGIGCFYLLDGVLQFNCSKEETDYLDVIAPAEHAEAVWHAIFDAITAESFPTWECCDLWNVSADSPTLHILETVAAQRGFSFARETAEVCPTIDLPETFDAYLAALPKKQRHEIKRKLRRATGAEAELEIITDPAQLPQAMDDFLRLLQSSTADKSAWLNEPRTAVFHATANAALAAETLQLMFIKIDGERAAALFNFAYNGRTWVYNSGLNPDAYGALSLGVVLSAQAIRAAIELGHTEFDFLRGDEAYKYRFGATDREIYRLTLNRS